MPIDNHPKCKWTEFIVKRHRVTEWIKKQDPSICCLQETHLKLKRHAQTKSQGMEKHISGKQ